MIFQGFEHIFHGAWVIQAALVAGILLILASVAVRKRLAGSDGGVLPDEGFTFRNLFEVIVEWLAGMAQDRMGPDWRKYFPIVGTMFFFILVSNLMGLVPGLAGSTSDANTTFAWAIIAWLLYTAIGITAHGPLRYLRKFAGPSSVWYLSWLFFPLEFVLDLARIVTLGVRLLANMFADHTVVAVWLGLIPIAVPAIFMGLGVVIAFLQAFVFALLTMIYIGLALEEPH